MSFSNPTILFSSFFFSLHIQSVSFGISYSSALMTVWQYAREPLSPNLVHVSLSTKPTIVSVVDTIGPLRPEAPKADPIGHKHPSTPVGLVITAKLRALYGTIDDVPFDKRIHR